VVSAVQPGGWAQRQRIGVGNVAWKKFGGVPMAGTPKNHPTYPTLDMTLELNMLIMLDIMIS
jgi:hypothetical protein